MRDASRISSIEVGTHLGRSFLTNKLRLLCVVNSGREPLILGGMGITHLSLYWALKATAQPCLGGRTRLLMLNGLRLLSEPQCWEGTSDVGRRTEKTLCSSASCVTFELPRQLLGTQGSSCYDYGLWSQLLTKPHSHLQASPSRLPGWRARAGAGLW